MKKKPTKGSKLALAVIWTFAAAVWIILTAVRFITSSDSDLLWLTVITALMNLFACVVFWLNYARHGKD